MWQGNSFLIESLGLTQNKSAAFSPRCVGDGVSQTRALSVGTLWDASDRKPNASALRNNRTAAT